MKKGLIIALITICVIVIISVIIFIKSIINKFENIEIITEEKFKEVMANNELEVSDITEEYNDVDSKSKIISVLYTEKENAYEIYLITLQTDNEAKNFYNNSCNYLENNISNSNMKNHYNIKSYGKYNVTTNTEYYSITRVKNTVLKITGLKEYKNDIKNIIKEFNY